jgi:uncharacterized protein
MAPFRPLRVVIPGGTGRLGQILARHFHEQGHAVTCIARHPKPEEWKTLLWNAYDLGEWARAIDGSDVVINLSGRSVNCRYNTAHRREILNSRTISTGIVGQAIARSSSPPRLWLNASTATIYPHSFDHAMDEVSGDSCGSEPFMPSKWNFSVEVANAWERALFAAETPKTRRIAMRSAMVMTPDDGGPFDYLLRLVRWGLGGASGSGKQYVSWIHEVDFIRAIEFLIANENMEGVVNFTSPNPIPNIKFMTALRRAWCTSYIGLPAPSWLLAPGALILRTEPELVLKSRRVVPRRLIESGFDFHFPNWRSACQDLVARWRELHVN